jgi:hypothetical protein
LRPPARWWPCLWAPASRWGWTCVTCPDRASCVLVRACCVWAVAPLPLARAYRRVLWLIDACMRGSANVRNTTCNDLSRSCAREPDRCVRSPTPHCIKAVLASSSASMHTQIRMCVLVCTCVGMCAHMCACVCMCVHVCACVCMCVHVCACVCMCVHVCA